MVARTQSGEVHKDGGGSATFKWTPDGRRLLYTNDTSGAENSHVYMLDVDDPADALDLTPYPGVKAVIQPGGTKRDEVVIAACNEFGIAMLFIGRRHFRH